NWDRGHLIREYTVLLDPPVYVPNPSQAASDQVAPAATNTAKRGGEIQRAQPASEAASPATDTTAATSSTEPAAATASPAPAADGGEPHSLIVRHGQTLSGIAARLSGAAVASAPTRSWMMAIYQANPSAFARNMNLLRSGSVLRVPESSTVAAISPAVALAEIHRQFAAWRGTSRETGNGSGGPGRLRLVAPQGGVGASGSPTTSGVAAGEVQALQTQVQTLQTQLADEHRALQLKDAELAQMQAQLAGKQAPQTAPAETAAATPPQASAPANTPPAPAPAEAPPSQTAAPPPVPANPPAQQASPPAQVAHHAPTKPATSFKPSSGGSILDTLARYWWAVALLVVALLGWIGSRAWRSRRQSDLDDSLGRLAAAGATPSPYTRLEPSTDDTAPMRPITADRDDAFVVEESGTHERPRLASATAAPKHVATAD
ncbi:MAG: FimV/HubP family polar landmark protein, partial [Solirubrobacteraceae bacterium]